MLASAFVPGPGPWANHLRHGKLVSSGMPTPCSRTPEPTARRTSDASGESNFTAESGGATLGVDSAVGAGWKLERQRMAPQSARPRTRRVFITSDWNDASRSGAHAARRVFAGSSHKL